MKRIAGIVLALFVMGFLTACGSGQAGLQDGYYTAQAAEYSHGWREYITIMVKDGSIVSVEYMRRMPADLLRAGIPPTCSPCWR